MHDTKRKPKRPATRSAGKRASFFLEPLEGRTLLAGAPWSVQDQLIGLDRSTQNYPTLTGSGETVAIIDRGVDYNHPELGGGFGPGHKIIDGYDFQDNSGDVFPYDGDAHGTGTAGQIAADPHVYNGELYQGVAPGVNIVALKTSGTDSTKAALDWIIGHRTQYNIVAINYVDMVGADANAFNWELQTLHDSGVFIAGPSGNYGPANAQAIGNGYVYSVGSVDLNDQISGFSPRGSVIQMVAPGGGVNISWYANGQHIDATSNGTSWAGPQVVGTAALIKQVNPTFTPEQVLSILRDSAHWVWDGNSNQSYPRLDVNAAITLAYQRSNAPPAAPAPVPAPAPQPEPAPTPTPTPTGGPGSPPGVGTGNPTPHHRHRWGHASVHRHSRHYRHHYHLKHHWHH